ncbi:MAG: hypothetical protein LBI28_13090 [Treponema sp.]|jgi:hypothetical protein|nr:hypothetical protein [Treponema sp.]
MKQVFLFALIMPMFCSAIFCDEIAYVATQNSVLDHRMTGREIAKVSEGEQVFYQGRIRGSQRNRGIGINRVHEILVRTEQRQEGWIQSNHILLQDNQPLSDSVVARRWIFSYYQDIIFESRREPLYKYEPFWHDQYDDTVKNTGIGGDPWWWYYSSPTDFYIRDNLIEISYILGTDLIYFASIKQEQNNIAIVIQCICTHHNFYPQNYWYTTFNEGETYQFIFKTDGDYIDVFLDDNPEKICTLIGVDEYFVNVIVGIVKGEPVDLTRVVWPRRMDGSMDYPPPIGIDMTRTYTDIFPIIEKPLPFLNTDDTAAGISQTDEIFETRKGTQALPLLALIAIIGGTVVVGGVALFVMKRKK